ncbi:hypothetical protein BCR44DRAFT_261457 [Catenaria anguillulae PL171]|uniref:Uncharacterized protein n=1 Tax=Catenaria anguillulae PL171 TaxID=765915 RepID=A0A1Y2H8U0_9FUNG|nr:hypothetical protein BCR44DRAFT_261457 [Catenaria anguillulae PL171]
MKMTGDTMQSAVDMLYHAFPSAATQLNQVVQAYSAAASNSPHPATDLLKQASLYLAQSPLVLVSGPTGVVILDSSCRLAV